MGTKAVPGLLETLNCRLRDTNAGNGPSNLGGPFVFICSLLIRVDELGGGELARSIARFNMNERVAMHREEPLQYPTLLAHGLAILRQERAVFPIRQFSPIYRTYFQFLRMAWIDKVQFDD
jgi:hypothetical protein